jgi:predicted glycoside hydrolase/deacetylase ChbG (UPF0249 family)
MPQRVIINADDLGLSPSVNSAIFAVHQAGNLTSATLMVNMPGTHDAVQRLPQYPALGVGLHFCLTEGHAVGGASSLTDAEGRFKPRPELARAALAGRIVQADVRHELEAQLARMDELGPHPTHVDSHQHVHMLPAILDAMLPVLRQRALAVRTVHPPRGALRASLGRPRKLLKQLLNRRLAAGAKARADLPTTDVLVSIHDLDHAGPYTAETYAHLLRWAPPHAVVELMVHPYIVGPDVLDLYAADLPAKQPFLDRCRAEYEALRHAPVLPHVELITFADL